MDSLAARDDNAVTLDGADLDMRPRVLFVGSSTYELPLSTGLARKWNGLAEQMELRVIGKSAGRQRGDARFRLVRLPGGGVGGAFHLALLGVLLNEVRSFKPDVVIAQSPYEALPLLATRRVVQPPPRLVVEVHGDWRTATRHYGGRIRRAFAWPADWVAALALRRADGTRAVGEFTAALAEQVSGRPPLATFPTYTDLETFIREPPNPLPPEPVVAWVGALQRVKNPDVLARAWPVVAERVPNARLVVVGDGPLRPIFDALARDPRVELIPQLPPLEVARVLDRSTVLALPSVSEGLPRVVIEAFTRGRPVVGSATAGIPDIVEHERNGLLIPSGDPDALAKALVRVLSNRAFAERLGTAARHDAERFRWLPERYADAVRALVDATMAQGPGHAGPAQLPT